MSLAAATRYANALADAVIGSQGSLDPAVAVQQLKDLESTVASSSELRSVLLSPAIDPERKRAVVGRLCDAIGTHRLVSNFVFLMVRNRRTDLLSQIRTTFERVLDERTGVVQAEIASASDLNPDARASLEVQLSRVTGKKVRCHYAVDGALAGGAIVRIGSTIYDGSVRGELEALRHKLSSGV